MELLKKYFKMVEYLSWETKYDLKTVYILIILDTTDYKNSHPVNTLPNTIIFLFE